MVALGLHCELWKIRPNAYKSGEPGEGRSRLLPGGLLARMEQSRQGPQPLGSPLSRPQALTGSRQGSFSFGVCTLGVVSKNSLQIQCQENFPLCFLLIVLYFELLHVGLRFIGVNSCIWYQMKEILRKTVTEGKAAVSRPGPSSWKESPSGWVYV